MNNQTYPRQGMKRKTIKTVLRRKIDEWTGTIENEELVKDIKRDVIVTGGSIASMLLGEKVNDFDIYFRTKETTAKVAVYYTQLFNNNLRNGLPTGEGVNAYEPTVVVDEDTGRVRIQIQSAGIAADTDVPYSYFEMEPETAQEAFVDSIDAIIEQEKKDEEEKLYRPVFLSENAVTLSNKLQIVIRFYGEPEEIHNNYDFAHAMNYYEYNDDLLVLKPEALECLLSRTLIYRGSLYPICSMIRVRKFMQRGWRISGGQLLKIAFQISELDLTDTNVLKEQLTGVDAAYFHQLLEALREVNLEEVDSTYIATIIDRIFGE